MSCLRDGFRLAAMAACLSGVAVCNALVYSDNFDDNMLDSSLWSLGQQGGPWVAEGNELGVFFPATSSGNDMYAGVASVFSLVGDFDVSVDFHLRSWPPNNGIRVGLVIPNYIGVERTDLFGFETYLTDTAGGLSMVPTEDRDGSMRVTRVGGTVSGFAWISGGWQLIGSHNGLSSTPTECWLRVWSHDWAFGHQDAYPTFDNFLAVDSAVPEPATWLTLGSLALIFRHRRR